MTFVVEFSKAAEAVSGLSVVDEPITHPYLQALAQSLRTLASLGEPLLISPAGTTGTIAKFTSPTTLGNSVITEVAGKIIIGVDPTGTDILRVGGNITLPTGQVVSWYSGGSPKGNISIDVTGALHINLNASAVLNLTTAGLIPAAAGGLTLGTSAVPWGNSFLGTTVVGVDPGGGQLLRVGGSGNFGGLVTVVAEKNAQVKWSINPPSGAPPDGTIWIQY